MKFKRLIIAVSAIAVIFGGIAISNSLGWWKTSSSRYIGSGKGASSNEVHDESETEDHSEFEVGGETTVGQALDMGIPEDVLKKYLGDTSDRDALVKDLIISNGFIIISH